VMPPDAPPRARLVQLLFGFYPAQVVHAMVELELPEHLDKGAATPGELAEAAGAHEQSLHRLLRAAAGLGLVTHGPDTRVQLTESGELLRRDAPGSIRNLAMLWAGDAGWRSWGQLTHSVRTGDPAYARVTGSSLFDHLQQHPAEQEIFNGAMAESSRVAATGVLAVCDLTSYPDVIDVGGGSGSLLAAILGKYPTKTGTLFDRPGAMPAAQQLLRTAQISDRAQAVGGDFFAAVPAGGSAYFLKNVLHDWNDDLCRQILVNCRQAMGPGVPLHIIEPIVPDDDAALQRSAMTLVSDLNMLVCTGGIERTAFEYQQLLAGARLTLESVTPCPTPSNLSVLRAVAA